MRKWMVLVGVSSLWASFSAVRGADVPDSGREAEQHSCLPCHSLRLIDSQRLSAAAWQKEIDKMIGWGAVVSNRQLLIDYLTQHYSNAQPPSTPVLSADSK